MVKNPFAVDYPVHFGLGVGWSQREGAGRMRELGWRGALVVESDWIPEVGELLALDVFAHGRRTQPLQIEALVTRRGPRCFWVQFLTLERGLTLLMRRAAGDAQPPRPVSRSGGA